MCAPLLYTIQYRTVLIIFPPNLQTVIIALKLSTGRGGGGLQKEVCKCIVNITGWITRTVLQGPTWQCSMHRCRPQALSCPQVSIHVGASSVQGRSKPPSTTIASLTHTTELRFYVRLDTKIGHFWKNFPSQSLSTVLKKKNPETGTILLLETINKDAMIHSIGYGLHTLTAVLRSTQPSILHGIVKWGPAYGLSNNNKWR